MIHILKNKGCAGFLLFLFLLAAAVVPAAAWNEMRPETDMEETEEPEEAEQAEEAEIYTVVFYNAKGKELETVTVEKGKEMELIRMADTKKATMMGWSTESDQTRNPKYLVGQTMVPASDLELYPVLFPREEEPDRTDALFSVKKTPYQNIIFVGDSRTKYMAMDLKRMEESKKETVLANISFIARGGSRYDWLTEVAWSRLEKKLEQCEGRTAVVFNHGVNDLEHADQYIEFYREQESFLEQYHADGYIMSVNPVNRMMEQIEGNVPKRTEKNVLAFNAKIRTQLCAETGYTYIDTFRFLMRNGYTFNDGSDPLGNHDYDDGVHFSAKTGKRIFLYAMRALRAVEIEA